MNDTEALLQWAESTTSAFSVKYGEECLSTVEVASINLHTGKTQLYKEGRAPTYLKKYNKTVPVGTAS